MPKNKIFIVYIIAILYIALAAFFISKENMLFNTLINIIPFALIIISLTIFSLDRLLFLIIFLTPLSIPISEFIPGIENDISLPIEPLLFGLLLLFILKLLFEKSFDKKILKHPISIAIYFNLAWIFITSVTSTMPIVSFKFLLARIWFLVTFFFLASHLFKNKKNINKYLWLFIFSYLIVILFAIYNHSIIGLSNQHAANQAPSPFLPDHTSYAAIIAMILPFVIGSLWTKKLSKTQKFFVIIALVILSAGMVFSYTRAAWVSLLGAIGVYLLIIFRIKFKVVFITGATILALFFTFQTQIFIALERNNQDSDDNFSAHIESISNISTDASNLERINRWSSAIRMFKAKPIFGFGPATYMFQYAPYQLASEKTIISTNTGDVGNAHSEYLGPLAEGGLLGMLTIIWVFVIVGITAMRVYNTNPNSDIRLLALVLFLGLITYFLHGFLNNFLDLLKNSAIFWSFSAIILALDVFQNSNKNTAITTDKNSKQ